MLDIRVELPGPQQVKLLRLLDPKRVTFAEREALNGTARDVQKTALKAISKEMGIPRSKLAKRGRRVDRSSRTGKMGTAPVLRATNRRLISGIVGYGRPFNLVRFNAQVIRGGATSSIQTGRARKGGGRVIGITHEAWGRKQAAIGLWQLKKGGPIVKRTGRWTGKRGGIEGAYGPGMTHVMQYPHIERRLQRVAVRVFPGRFKKRLRYAFSSQSHIR